MTVDDAARKRNRRMLVAIFVIFLGSFAVAGVLRFSGWRPAGLKNKGELLRPPADLRASTPRLVDGGEYAWDPAARVWRIALAPPADCGPECGTALRDANKVRQLLGREAVRVDLLWLCPDERCPLPAGVPRPTHLRVLRADASLRAKLPGVQQVRHAGGRGVPVYVIDPNGFVVLRYAAGSDPADLRTDLARLLKLK